MNKQCVFVNTDQNSISVKNISNFVEFDEFTSNLKLYAVEEITYPHPEAPDYATVSLIRLRLVHTATRTDPAYPALYNLMLAQQGINSISQHLPEL